MQQAMIGNNYRVFMAELNEHLMNGWTVVPGTWDCRSVERPALPSTPERYRIPGGRQIETIYFVVLEEPRDDSQPEKSGSAATPVGGLENPRRNRVRWAPYTVGESVSGVPDNHDPGERAGDPRPLAR